MSFPPLQAPADAKRWETQLTAPLGTPALTPPSSGGALARCIVGIVVWPKPACDYKVRDSAPLSRLVRSPRPRPHLGFSGPGHAGLASQRCLSWAPEAEVGGGGTGRSFARGVNARLTCSFASRPLRANPVSPRRRRWNAEGAEGARGGGGNSEMAETVADTRRLITKPQNLNDAYGPPSNFLEIDVSNPQTVGVGRGRFTTYEIRVKVRPSFSPAVRPLLPSRLAPSRPRSECPQAAQLSRPGAAG